MPAPPEIGPYRVLGPLGQGGMGTVWLAEDPRLARRVAIKLFAGPEARTDYARDQLLREARAAASLNHPNIAGVHDVVDVEGQVAVVFEYVEGETLAVRIARGRLSVSAGLGVALQLADALCAAHERGIVHRDLKPPNIVVARDGGVKVLDFGVARVLPAGAEGSGARTTAGGFVGTIGYAAPEQCLGQAGDSRADIFSLGVVMYEALTGERPFPGSDSTTVMRAILKDSPPRVASSVRQVPEPLDALVAQMLAAEPARRPQSARQVREALQAIAPAVPGSTASADPRRRAWAITALVSAALLTGGLVASLVSTRPQADSTRPPVVAVLPLTNASADSANEYLAIGVADGLITRLASLPSITVLSRPVVAEARRQMSDTPTLAARLDAAYLVDGTVVRIADRLRIDLRLVQPDGSITWADDVEGSFDRVFELQARLASALAHALSVRLSAAERASLVQQPTSNPDALGAYWRGRAFLDRRDIKGNVDAALAAFDEAVRLDPRFADAHAARGQALWSRYLDSRDPVHARGAVEAGTTALRLNPNGADVRYTLAVTLGGTGQLEAAIEELQRALALRPNFEDARIELGRVLARQGRTDEAIAEFRKAAELRPSNAAPYSGMGTTFLEAGRYGDAAEAFAKSVALQPDNAGTHTNLGGAYHYLGRLEDALASYNRANAIRPSAAAFSNIGVIHHQRGEFSQAVAAYEAALTLRPSSAATHRNLGDTYQRMGRRSQAQSAYREAMRLAEATLSVNPRDPNILASSAVYAAKAGDWVTARQRLEAARRLAPSDGQVSFRAAVVHALAGEHDRALAALEEAVARGYSRTEIAADEDFADLRNTARFKSIVQERPPPGGAESRTKEKP